MFKKGIFISGLVVFAVLLITRASTDESMKSPLKRMVERNNKSNLPWKSVYNAKFDIPEDILKSKYFGLEGMNKVENLTHIIHSNEIKTPTNFKISDNWNCKSFNIIRDQSSCGSCWAVAAESVMSDRKCIENLKNTGYDDGISLSSADIMANCSYCGFGCNGGYTEQAFEYLRREGVVTGGENKETNTCYPYPFVKCSHHVDSEDYKDCSEYNYSTPDSTSTCPNRNFNWNSSKYYSKLSVTVSGIENIKKELYLNGSLAASFMVLEGFMTYDSGVYNCSEDKGDFLGYHAVRLVGYGVESAGGKLRNYWLVANNWNEGWGDNGYIKFDMESDCGIASSLVATSGIYQ